MTVDALSAVLRPCTLRERIARASALILDVDGMLAETEGISAPDQAPPLSLWSM
jgi:hypothetical protein